MSTIKDLNKTMFELCYVMTSLSSNMHYLFWFDASFKVLWYKLQVYLIWKVLLKTQGTKGELVIGMKE